MSRTVDRYTEEDRGIRAAAQRLEEIDPQNDALAPFHREHKGFFCVDVAALMTRYPVPMSYLGLLRCYRKDLEAAVAALEGQPHLGQ